MARIKKGDRVVVIRVEEMGKQGKIVRVLPERDMVVIEGVNLVKKHLAATPREHPGVEPARPFFLCHPVGLNAFAKGFLDCVILPPESGGKAEHRANHQCLFEHAVTLIQFP